MRKRWIFLIGLLLIFAGSSCYYYLFLSKRAMVSFESFMNEQNILRKTLPASLDSTFFHGSNLDSIPVNEQHIGNLQILGYVWGFLKYYHPNIAVGNYNMDAELFRFLPRYLQVQNEAERDALLLQWTERFGPYKPGKRRRNEKQVKTEPDLAWIYSLSSPLSQKLDEIRNARRSGKNYYVSFGSNGYYPVFFEEKYPFVHDPDSGMRLLSLFRYWNIIHYFFPYKNLIQEDWKEVLKEFIPLFLQAGNRTDYTLTALKLIARIHDTHAGIVNSTELEHYLGERYTLLQITFVESQAVVSKILDTTLYTAGWEVGDVITHVEGEMVESLVAAKLHLIPGSNYPTQLRNMASILLRSNQEELTVQVRDKGEKILRTFSIQSLLGYIRREKNQADTAPFKVLPGNIGYIHNGLLSKSQIPRMWEAIRNTRGLVIDNRNYPSDMPLYELCAVLANRSKPFVMFSRGSLKEPGLFTLGFSMQTGRNEAGGYAGKIAILVNENTQSASEFHAMAYRALDRAVVVGSTTAGADGDATDICLPGNILTKISGIGVYYPDGSDTQRVGIVPNIEVRPTVAGIKAGRDEVLEKALEVLAN